MAEELEKRIEELLESYINDNSKRAEEARTILEFVKREPGAAALFKAFVREGRTGMFLW